MSQADLHLPQQSRFTETSRRDKWWLVPLLTFLGLFGFVVYSTWAAWQGANYEFDAYLSPMYSPLLFEAGTNAAKEWHLAHGSHHALFGPWPSWLGWMPAWMPMSPAFFILIFPGGFRLTCYYYRGAYYKAFWADPLTCSVGEPRKKYLGEQTWPLIAQNIHRYFLYAAILFIGVLTFDAFRGMYYSEDWQGKVVFGEGGAGFGIGIGSLVLIINVFLLGGYTFGCHSLRHLIGGKYNLFSRHPKRKVAYECVSCLNAQHMLWAWCSLFWVGFTDFYIRMCASGVFTDVRLF
ncbi:MAG: succinate dehydrogenase [Planctomycetota bacterium]|nr:succinate dehydrogenase [Planctomycetota bacterium]